MTVNKFSQTFKDEILFLHIFFEQMAEEITFFISRMSPAWWWYQKHTGHSKNKNGIISQCHPKQRCKNTQQNISKPNLAIYKSNVTAWQNMVYLEIQGLD